MAELIPVLPGLLQDLEAQAKARRSSYFGPALSRALKTAEARRAFTVGQLALTLEVLGEPAARRAVIELGQAGHVDLPPAAYRKAFPAGQQGSGLPASMVRP